jgi:hypothetical protein
MPRALTLKADLALRCPQRRDMWSARDTCARHRHSSCIFCDIASDACSPRVVRRDDLVVAFEDIDAAAKAHILVREVFDPRRLSRLLTCFQVIPREHIGDLSVLDNEVLCE